MYGVEGPEAAGSMKWRVRDESGSTLRQGGEGSMESLNSILFANKEHQRLLQIEANCSHFLFGKGIWTTVLYM